MKRIRLTKCNLCHKVFRATGTNQKRCFDCAPKWKSLYQKERLKNLARHKRHLLACKKYRLKPSNQKRARERARAYTKTERGQIVDILKKLRIAERKAEKNRAAFGKKGYNGWPDQIEFGKVVEIKRGLDRMRWSQILMHDWMKLHWGVDVIIRWFPKTNSKKFLEFSCWRVWKAYLEARLIQLRGFDVQQQIAA